MHRLEVPDAPAVYAVYIASELVYIGQTVSLRGRFSDYQFRYGYSDVIRTPWGDFPSDSKIEVKAHFGWRYGDWAMREIRLIRRLHPRFNTHHRRQRAA